MRWSVDGVVQAGQTEQIFLYQVTGAGAGKEVTVAAAIQGVPATVDTAKVMLTNYDWPGLH